jgi:hypothetical protein
MRLRCPRASCSAISLLQCFGLFFRHPSNLPPNQLICLLSTALFLVLGYAAKLPCTQRHYEGVAAAGV